MTEKINGQGFRPVDPGSARRSEKSGQSEGQPAGASDAPSARDTVNVGRAEALVGQLNDALEIIPVVDAERVKALRDAIASGTYDLDPSVIADKIIQLERELNY